MSSNPGEKVLNGIEIWRTQDLRLQQKQEGAGGTAFSSLCNADLALRMALKTICHHFPALLSPFQAKHLFTDNIGYFSSTNSVVNNSLSDPSHPNRVVYETRSI